MGQVEKEIAQIEALADFAKRWATDKPGKWRVFVFDGHWRLELATTYEQRARGDFDRFTKECRLAALADPLGWIVAMSSARMAATSDTEARPS